MANAQKSKEEKEFLSDLPKVSWRSHTPLFQYKGYWLIPELMESTMAIQSQFKPLPTDIIIASFPKTGTTWAQSDHSLDSQPQVLSV